MKRTSEGSRSRLLLRGLAPATAILVFLLALAVLHRELSAYGYREIANGVRALPAGRLLSGLGLTLVSIVVLTSYDALALRYIHRPLAYARAAFASLVGYAFSLVQGSPLLTGAPVRSRLYAAWELSTDEIGRIVAFGTATTWIGLLTVAGATLLLLPAGLPDGIPLWATRSLGITCVALVLGYMIWTFVATEPLRILSWELPLPSPRLAAGQLTAGVVDWLVGAGVLYVLLPPGHGLPFVPFVAIFTLALALGQTSLIPGGLGVFEAVFLLLLPESIAPGSVIPSLVAYRGIYHLLPLILASAGLAIHEIGRRREVVERTVGTFGRGVSAVAPLTLSALVFIAGGLLLMTGSLPTPRERLAWLGRALPLSVIELSHFLGSLVGAGLLIVARGLRQRLDAAYRLALILLATGAVLSVVRGLGWAETVGLLVILLVLLPVRREFFRTTPFTSEPPSRRWVGLVGIALAGTVWLGLYVHRQVDLTADLWWEFTLRGDAPRFLRASLGATALVLAYGLSRVLRPVAPGSGEEAEGEIPPEVDAVVASSDRAHAVLVHLGDKQVLPSESGRAFVMYAVEGRSWIAMGDPVGDPEEFDELIWQFRSLAHRRGGWPVFYQTRPDFLSLYADIGLGAVKLGEEAYVPLEEFGLAGGARKGLRRTVRKVEGEGATFEILPPEDVAPALPELREISEAWLKEKQSREKGFSLGFFSEEYLLRTPIAVLRMDGKLVAFANVLASGSRSELSADLMRYGPGAPASAMEYLFIRLMLWGASEGYTHFSLGMAPLAGLEDRPLAPMWNRLGAAMFRYGGHFYNFRGLRAYKEKFDPVWEPRYLVTPGGLAFPRIVANVATLIGGGVRGVLIR